MRSFSSKENNGGHSSKENNPNQITGPGAQKGTIPSDFEHAVGLERLQLLSDLAGKSLFTSHSAPLQHTVKGTLSEPVLVESLAGLGEGEGRIVGCSGMPRGSHEIGFFWVKSAKEATRCPECGQAFKLRLV